MMRRGAMLAVTLAGFLGTSAPVIAAPPAPAPAAVQPTDAPRAVQRSDDDARRYAEREKSAKDQQAYEGGDNVVIGISTGALIIILILLVILL
jgi:hypothetical protein